MHAQYRRNDRKYKASTQLMHITYFKLEDNHTDFRVGVIGSRKIPYILDFSQSSMNITCTCPDFEKREHKPLCKHMLFIVNLSNQKAMFNNLLTHNELKDLAKLSIIRDSLMAIIDEKKIGDSLSEANTVSIERDDFCSICMCDLDTQIEKCTCCSHVMHVYCITSWWELSNSWNSKKGKCPYCKDPTGFSHIKNKEEDPWNLFDFHTASAEEPPALEEEAANQPILPEPLALEEEAANQPILPEPPALEEEANEEGHVYNSNNSIISVFLRSLRITERERNTNMDEHFEILQQQHDAIQNAFQAQEE
jgi:hypothetical protein